MTEARFMTHAERAKRRGEIKQALRSGMHAPEVAAKFGMSREYVCQIAKAAGIKLRRPGVPKGALLGRLKWPDCPPHLRDEYKHLIYRQRMTVAEVREILRVAA